MQIIEYIRDSNYNFNNTDSMEESALMSEIHDFLLPYFNDFTEKQGFKQKKKQMYELTFFAICNNACKGNNFGSNYISVQESMPYDDDIDYLYEILDFFLPQFKHFEFVEEVKIGEDLTNDVQKFYFVNEKNRQERLSYSTISSIAWEILETNLNEYSKKLSFYFAHNVNKHDFKKLFYLDDDEFEPLWKAIF